jgi:hypothetical protein
LTTGTVFNAGTVEVAADGTTTINKDKHLSETMPIPEAPIQVDVTDVTNVPKFKELKDIDTVFENRGPTSTPSPSPIPNPGSGSSDTTAPRITAATINGNAVDVTNGASGEITLPSNLSYLTEGTITVNEAATLTITSIGILDFTLYDFPNDFFKQYLNSGTNTLDFIEKLDELDGQENGVSISYLSLIASDNDGNIVINGTLRDNSGNSRNVTLTIKLPLL